MASGRPVRRDWHSHAHPVHSLLPGITSNSFACHQQLRTIKNSVHSFSFVCCEQYLKNFQTRQLPILERFALLICITVIWAYAHLLTASGAYKHRPELTQVNCRTDKAYLISSAPWLVTQIFCLNIYNYLVDVTS